MFEGTHTALITPFTNGNRNVDESALRALVEKQIAGGIAGVVPVGTTGESPTLSHEEHQRVIEITIEAANKRCLVTAGTGSNSTREAVALTVAAEKAGADAAQQPATANREHYAARRLTLPVGMDLVNHARVALEDERMVEHLNW